MSPTASRGSPRCPGHPRRLPRRTVPGTTGEAQYDRGAADRIRCSTLPVVHLPGAAVQLADEVGVVVRSHEAVTPGGTGGLTERECAPHQEQQDGCEEEEGD